MTSRGFLGASIMAAVAASSCCILPMVLALAGVSLAGAAGAFAPWRPYLLAVTFALLVFGIYFAYWPARRHCEPGAACARPGVSRSGRIGLWMATALVLALAGFPYYSGPVAGRVLWGSAGAPAAAGLPPTPVLFGQQKLASDATARIKVKGMTCGSCAVSVKKALTSTKGVKKADVSLEKGLAVVVYDHAQVDEEQIRAAINKTGFQALPGDKKREGKD